MKKLHSVALFVSILALVACGGTEQKREIITLDTLLATPDEFVNDTISVKGFCVSVCNSGSNHLTLTGSDTTVIIEAVANPKLLSFDDAVLHSDVVVGGVFMEQRVSREFLNDWEFRLDESLKGENANHAAVADLKSQIAQIRAIIDEREKSEGKDYWSQYRIEALEYSTEE